VADLKNKFLEGRVRFPYVTEEEIQSMELAIQNAFNDLQSNVAIKRARNILIFKKICFIM